MQDLFRALKGVVTTEVGYTGGTTNKKPTYEIVKGGASGHAESLRILFDPKVTTYKDILLYFFRIHDPTTVDRQGNDRGSQYRSGIFYLSEEQKKQAEEVMAQINKSKQWKAPLVTKLEKGTGFYRAEEYHQDYLVKNPGGYTCHYERKF